MKDRDGQLDRVESMLIGLHDKLDARLPATEGATAVSNPWAWSTGPSEYKLTTEAPKGCSKCPCIDCKEQRLKDYRDLPSK